MKVKNILVVGSNCVLVETNVGDFYISGGKKYFKSKKECSWQKINKLPQKVEAAVTVRLL